MPDEMTDWIREGDKLRKNRISRDMSLREESKRLGISAVKLGEAERGVVDPATFMEVPK